MFPAQKKQEEPTPDPVVEVKDEARNYRIEQFRDLRFSEKEAQTLADSMDSQGFPIYWRKVANALEAGCGHKMAVWIFSSGE